MDTKQRIEKILAEELQAGLHQIVAAIELIDEGSTVPFIARYRKERTGGLDDSQLRKLNERLTYLRDLEARREAILASIIEQEKLTPELEQTIRAAETKQRLEDLYVPYKRKKRSKSMAAREAGLEVLADLLLADPSLSPEKEAARFFCEGFADVAAVLEGTRQILTETMSEDPELIGRLREDLWQNGFITSKVVKGKQVEGVKFADYFSYRERIKSTPSHRALAMFRGAREEFLKLTLVPEAALLDDPNHISSCEHAVAQHFKIASKGRPGDLWLIRTVEDAWKKRILPHLRSELFSRLKDSAETEAISVFAANLNDLMLAPPAGGQVTLGIDPGMRTGCKVVVIDATGKLLEYTTLYPHPPARRYNEALEVLVALCSKHKVALIAFGNGTGSRETDRLLVQLIKENPTLNLQKVLVSEAGASVYSASELAAAEFPDLDVTIRGAVSIARRLQDPLAELVKIEPKAIGVGQYQHDVNQTALAARLTEVVETCVNTVGVDLNTASAELLTYISGLSKTMAHNLVEFRDKNGAFKERQELMQVERMGPKTFQQCAGFLRIGGGRQPLDCSAVHPEAYELVGSIAKAAGVEVGSLIGNSAVLAKLEPKKFITESFGLPTISDIFSELDKPGRDPRGSFKNASFSDGIEDIEDLEVGMVLEGVVSNVTNFGAFVDVGIHQDGLVHVSQMADRFVAHPRDVVKAGDLVKVRVMEVDKQRRRIALTMKL